MIKPTAPIDSLAPTDILATVFASSVGENGVEGGEPALGPRRFGVDLSAFAGQTVRLRIAVAANEKPLLARVDAVSIASTPILAPAPLPIPTSTPSSRIRKGKLTLNKKTGTGMLAVTVPGAGTLTAIDASKKIAIASGFARAKRPRKPALIKAAILHPAAAGTVRVPFRPTAAARKLLSEKGALAFRARLTFTPTGGTAATQVYRARLAKLKVRR